MRPARYWVPVLGIIALMALFLGLPEVPNVFSTLGCKTCSSNGPILPLLGAGYFAVLVAVSLLFPSFPGPLLARGGLTWATLLALALTSIKWPSWCVVCLIGHACNVLIWAIWAVVPPSVQESPGSALRERLCLTLFAPVSVVALFSAINLTLMAYGFKLPNVSATSLQTGDAAPTFSTLTSNGRLIANTDATQTGGIVINFVSPDCPYCEEQLPILNAVASQLGDDRYRFINVSRALPPELVERSPAAEWVEDQKGELRELFDVSGYPTMFVVRTDGTIAQVIPGVPERLEADLLAGLGEPRGDGANAATP